MKPQTTQHLSLVLATLLSGMSVAHADPAPPNAGTLLQEIAPSTLPAQPTSNSIDLPEASPTDSADSQPFLVKSITLQGNKSIDTATLHALVQPYEGKTLTLQELQAAARKITEYYRSKGYSFARAVLPPQEINQGEVMIKVIEAYYGAIDYSNPAKISDSLIQSTLSPLHTNSPIELQPLDRALLLLSDIPGATTSALLRPGSTPGTSDISLEIQPGPSYTARVGLDDLGNRYTGRWRATGALNLLSPLHHGDIASINLITSGEQMQYGRFAYDWLVNGSGLRIGAAYTSLNYKLGEELKDLKAHGWANTGETWARYPILRGRNSNLYGSLMYQYSALSDQVDVSNIKTDRNLKTGIFGLNGDIRDNWGGGGISSFSAAYSLGEVAFDNADAKIADAATANTNGQYGKWTLNANRLQAVGTKAQLWASFSAQGAQDNLDYSQKMVFGGPYSVRAYDAGAIAGDSGYLATLELRRLLGQYHGQIQGVLFADTGYVEVNHQRWAAATGANSTTLSGVGAGINWVGQNQWLIKTYIAKSVGAESSLTSAANKSIGWFELSKAF